MRAAPGALALMPEIAFVEFTAQPTTLKCLRANELAKSWQSNGLASAMKTVGVSSGAGHEKDTIKAHLSSDLKRIAELDGNACDSTRLGCTQRLNLNPLRRFCLTSLCSFQKSTVLKSGDRQNCQN
jgi:hypothetical protein